MYVLVAVQYGGHGAPERTFCRAVPARVVLKLAGLLPAVNRSCLLSGFLAGARCPPVS